MKQVTEKHWVASPVISYINNEIELDFIPLVKRTLYKKFLFWWIPIKSQTIRKDLNEYIRVCTLGGELNYDHYWDKELKQLT
jgi:hypothetical protein